METKRKKRKVYTSKVLENFFTVKDKKEYKRTENNMLLALRIEKAMIAKGLNRSQFSTEMGVDPSVITKWLSGTHNFTSNTLFDIEDALSICLVNTSEPPNIQSINKFQVVVISQTGSSYTPSYFDNSQSPLINIAEYSYGKC